MVKIESEENDDFFIGDQLQGQGHARPRPDLITPSGKMRKIHHCPHCDYISTHLTHVTRHIRVHTGTGPNCFFGDLTNSWLTLKKGEKPFKCDYEGCIKSFSDKSTHKRHLMTHTNSKPFPCSLCNYSTRRKKNLLFI